MKILMLGWEFPPFISGGLGTACYGLTRALDRLGHRVTFVLPKTVDRSMSSHVDLVSPEGALPPPAGGTAGRPSGTTPNAPPEGAAGDGEERVYTLPDFRHVRFVDVPAQFTSPYPEGGGGAIEITEEAARLLRAAARRGAEPGGGAPHAHDEAKLLDEVAGPGAGGGLNAPGTVGADYSGDVVARSREYAMLALRLCRHLYVDVVHAHDWMTYPAGMALSRVKGVPLVAHIHSTEFDRSGEHVNQRVYDIERRGMHAAALVLAVSQLTRSIVTTRYGVDPAKVRVVYNGIDQQGFAPPPDALVRPKDKIVLFLGRITMQKGPEYFVAAAKRVLDKMDNVKFLVAGNGDLARRMIEQAAELGIGHKVLFTGFLRGKDVERVFSMADCFVMPSVSEPFGIVPLEALRHDTPVIISKQSGVSEVLTHALKVDFWDVDEMANKIIAVLKHPPLGQTLTQHGALELRALTWDGAAEKCVRAYHDACAVLRGGSVAVPLG